MERQTLLHGKMNLDITQIGMGTWILGLGSPQVVSCQKHAQDHAKKSFCFFFKTLVTYVLQLLPITAVVLAPVVGLPFYGP